MFQELHGVRFEILQRAGERREFEGSICWPEVDQFAMMASGQQQVIQELRTMLVSQMVNRLQLENGSTIDEQVDGIRFAEIGVFHHKKDSENRKMEDRKMFGVC
jgi:hypothetical protein